MAAGRGNSNQVQAIRRESKIITCKLVARGLRKFNQVEAGGLELASIGKLLPAWLGESRQVGTHLLEPTSLEGRLLFYITLIVKGSPTEDF